MADVVFYENTGSGHLTSLGKPPLPLRPVDDGLNQYEDLAHSDTDFSPVPKRPVDNCSNNYEGVGHTAHPPVPEVYETLKKPKTQCNRTVLCLSIWLGIMTAAVITLLYLLLVWKNTRSYDEVTTSNHDITNEIQVTTSTESLFTFTSPTAMVPHTESHEQCAEECEPTLSCTKVLDPTACDRCRNAQVRIGHSVLCVDSCENVGLATDDVDQSGLATCASNATVQVTNCTASSAHPNQECEKAYDGSTKPGTHEWTSYETNGMWIQVNFPGVVYVHMVTIWFRCANFDQFKHVRLDFSDGSHFEADRVCTENSDYSNCDGKSGETFTFTPRQSLYLNITGSDCM